MTMSTNDGDRVSTPGSAGDLPIPAQDTMGARDRSNPPGRDTEGHRLLEEVEAGTRFPELLKLPPRVPAFA